MSSSSFRVRIPRPTEGAEAPSAPQSAPEGEDLPGTFITAMPPLGGPEVKEIQVTAIQPPYSYGRISYNEIRKEHLYEAIEPQLSSHERELVDHMKATLTQIMGPEVSSMSMSDKRAYLRGEVETYLKSREISIGPLSVERLIYYIQRDFVGYGPVDALIQDPEIEDISCDGVGIPIYVWHRDYESIPTNVQFAVKEELASFIIRLAYKSGGQITVAQPILEGSLPEGFRIHLTLDEVSKRGSTFTI